VLQHIASMFKKIAKLHSNVLYIFVLLHYSGFLFWGNLSYFQEKLFNIMFKV